MIWHASFNVWDVPLLHYSWSTQKSLPLGFLLRVQVLLALLSAKNLAVSRNFEALRRGLSGLELVLACSDLLCGGGGAICARIL